MGNYSDILIFGNLTSEEVKSQLNKKILVLPLGSIEQHGPHLPLTVDIDIVQAIAIEISSRLGGVLAPEISYTARSLPQTGGGSSFHGNIHVRGEVLIRYLTDIVTSFVESGCKTIFILNGHYENEQFLYEAIEVCRESRNLKGVRIIALSWWSVIKDKMLNKIFPKGFPGWHAEHAGICETSLMMYLKPNLVRSERPDNPTPPIAGVYLHPVNPEVISNRGVLANTTGSSAEIGKDLFEHICDQIKELILHPCGIL